MNNSIMMDHRGLFIYLDFGYPGSYHDINILHQLNIHKSWHQYFVHTYEYFKYLLGDPNYMGECMFMMHHIKRCELVPRVHVDVVNHTTRCNIARFDISFHFKVWFRVLGSRFRVRFKIHV
jgi:hypothetical protein